jgi:hypothetical protein
MKCVRYLESKKIGRISDRQAIKFANEGIIEFVSKSAWKETVRPRVAKVEDLAAIGTVTKKKK